MHKITTFLLTCFSFSFAYAQTVKELYIENKYDELVKYEQKADALTGEELYMVGLAFYERQI
ncbi:MAG: hypothetical protein JNN28_11800 [Saprospiraceae bacterium]|nr:hypothetical protein [Saprospiraceae bacterium]